MHKEKLENGATYRTIGLYREVVVNVPKKSDYMRWVQGGFPVADVPDHWAHGKQFERQDKRFTEKAVVINCNFYGLKESDLGRRIVAEIKVIYKITSSGGVYLMLDIIKMSGGAAFEMKFVSLNEIERFPKADKFHIAGTGVSVVIAPLASKMSAVAA